jgi:hypothetical protein
MPLFTTQLSLAQQGRSYRVVNQVKQPRRHGVHRTAHHRPGAALLPHQQLLECQALPLCIENIPYFYIKRKVRLGIINAACTVELPLAGCKKVKCPPLWGQTVTRGDLRQSNQ